MSKNQSGSYDIIAPFYDDGVGLLFGKGIFDAQLYFLSEITPGSSVLILGGGSGWLLAELLKKVPNVEVCYVDASEKMIKKARTKTIHPVDFIFGTENDIPSNSSFDFIITNFYVDGFPYNTLVDKIKQISVHLKSSGKWIVTDFVETGKKKHRRILWLIHLFFRILINHPNKKLADWRKAFEECKLKVTNEKDFNDEFIKTLIYS